MYIYRILFTAIIILCSLSFCPASTNIPDSITVDMSAGPIHIEGTPYDTVHTLHTANCSIINIYGLKDSSNYVLKFLFQADSVPLFLIIGSGDKHYLDLGCKPNGKFTIKKQIKTLSKNLSIIYKKPFQNSMRFTHIYYYSDEVSNLSDSLKWSAEQNKTIFIKDSSFIGTISKSDTILANIVINKVKKSINKNFGFFYVHYDIEPVRNNITDLIFLERLNYKFSREWNSLFKDYNFKLERILCKKDSFYTNQDTVFSSDSTIHTLRDFTHKLIKKHTGKDPKNNKYYDQADPVQVSKEVYICDDDIFNALEKVYPKYEKILPSDSIQELQDLFGIVTNDERYNTKGIKHIYEVINPKSTTQFETGCFTIVSQTGLMKVCRNDYANQYRNEINKLNNKVGSILYQSGLAQRKHEIFDTNINLPIDQENSLLKIKSMLSFYIEASDSLSQKKGMGLFNFDETTYLNNSLLLEQNVLQLHKKHLNYLKEITDYELFRDIFLEKIKKKQSKASERLNLILVLVTLLIGIFLYDVPDNNNQKASKLSTLKVLESLFLSLTIIAIFILAILLYSEVYTCLEIVFWLIVGFSGLTLLLKIIRTFCLLNNVKACKYYHRKFKIYKRKLSRLIKNYKNKKELHKE